MKPISRERWQQIEDVLDRVLDAPESDRSRTLDEACGGDVPLRREVETLLRASETAGTKFDVPPLLVARDALESPPEPERDVVGAGDLIGPYRIVRLLGRGGMGAVYLAERADGTFEKNVALKIVKRGMDTDEIIQRFHHERRILARFGHPSIAGILDGGITPDGLPYFAMELAEGHPIDDWCDEHTLTVRERLMLFQTVCAAVQYAHGNLVVHRDLKPSNIFVSEGEVKLLDFGIAKLLGPDTDAPYMTQAFAARLTPQYASPEQMRGEATTTLADVYSLGVILYELLCGRSPYRLEGKTLLEMEQTVCREEPVRASVAVTRVKDAEPPDQLARARGLSRADSLVQTLRGDLDAICAKALRKDSTDRYISAAALSEDIQRFLEGRPVRAHPPHRGYRLRKFVQRNRAFVALTTVTGVALVAATVVTLIMFARARDASRRQQEEARRATSALQFVINVLSGFNPEFTPGQRQFSPGDIVDQGVGQLPPLAGQPTLQATVMNTLAQIALSLGLVPRADSLYRQALLRLDSVRDTREYAASLLGLGEVRRRRLLHEEGEAYIRRAVRLLTGLNSPIALADARRALAFTLYNVGDSVRLAEADSLYRLVLQTASLPATTRADALEGLADVEAANGRRNEAIRHYDEAIRTRSEVLGEHSPANARGMWGPVLALLALKDFRRAEALARTARGILIDNFGLYHSHVAWSDLYLGFALDSLQRSDTAVSVFREAAMITDSVEAPGAYYNGRAHYLAARSLQRLRRFGEAEQELRESLRIFAIPSEGEIQRVPPGIADSEFALGQVIAEQQRDPEAVRHFRAAFDAWAGPLQRPRQAAAAAEALAEIYSRTGPPDSAVVWRARVISARGT
jgi:serine/threonine-protein kinase